MFFLKQLPTRQMIECYAERFGTKPENVEKSLLLLREASLLVRELDSYFASHHFSQLRFLILMVIDREPDKDSLFVSEIADRLDVSKPVITRTLQSLLSDQFINMTADNVDSRAKQVSLTKKGKTFLVEILPGYFEIIGGFKE